MLEPIIATPRQRMEKSLAALAKMLSGLRTGRAHPDLLGNIMVSCYGTETPINQVAGIDVANARTLTVSVWDSGLLPAVDKAIRNSATGLNPVPGDDGILRIPLPPLSEERRGELIKVARTETEQARVAIRNIRRDCLREIRQQVKDSDCGEDEQHRTGDQLQKLTDKSIAAADAQLEAKQKELMTV